VSSFNKTLFERMRDMNRSRLERLREMHRIESEFGTELLSSENPSEATSICSRWMAKRLEIMANEQHAFATAWLGLLSEVIKDSKALASVAQSDVKISRSGADAEVSGG
jgi:hypothetical protein